MASIAVSLPEKEYGKLLQHNRPAVIRTEVEYDHCLSQLQRMMASGKGSEAEGRMMELYGLLLQDYEKRRFRMGETATPLTVLRFLMEAHGVKHKDVWRLFGSKGVASEVLNGKRAISKEVAKRLASFFHVSVEVFL